MGTVGWTKAQPLAFLLLLLSACVPLDDDGNAGDGPGSKPWHEEEIRCESDAECGSGERCVDGGCQLARCTESYSSKPPLGTTHFFGVDGELTVVSDGNYLDAFEGQGGEYLGSLEAGGPIADVVGGNFDGSRPLGIAVAFVGGDAVELTLAGGTSSLAVGLSPVALGAGDVDGDGLDELVALAQNGALAICDVDQKKCTGASVGSASSDLSVADVDGDGFAEPVALGAQGDRVIVYNADSALTQQPQSASHELSFVVTALAAADFDGDGAAEIALLEDRGWLGFASDRLHLMSGAGSVGLSVEVSGAAIDITAGDRDADGKAEIALLRDDHQLELLRMHAGGLVPVAVVDVVVGQTLQHVAIIDWDGDSTSGELVEGPVLVSGEVVPTMAVALPPYPEGYAEGVSGVWIGEANETAVSASRTVSLELGIMVGVGFESPVLEASVGVSLSRRVELSQEFTRSVTVAQYFNIDAHPDQPREEAGGVVVACGCYHRYRYRTDDPHGTVGGSDQQVDIFVPVAGQTQMWSPKRYNAMARDSGTMPIIEIPYRVGDVSSYPATPVSLQGGVVAPEDLLFPDVPIYQASEIANVEFWLSAGESETNETVETTEIGVNGSFGAGGLEVELSAEAGLSLGYSIEVGSEALFIGWVPPVPDDPETPEDEHKLHQYGFSPLVYRQRYLDPSGQEAGYYVLGYNLAGP